jgi:selenide,water dikinase
MEIKLTQHSKGGGCGCKIAPSVLSEILAAHNVGAKSNIPQLLVGNDSRDDAAVYQIDDKTAMISTTDFFMPIVDDAFAFGQIAAANAISDVYAMGGKPIFALAVLGWPLSNLPASVAAQVMEGARKTCSDAGIVIAGGHSIDSQDPIFGLVVNGLVDIENLKRNDTAKEGDLLIITKPLGVGILATSQKRGLLTDTDLTLLVKQLTTINKAGEALGKIKGVNAMTDITGFGFIGHLLEICKSSNLGAEIEFVNVPLEPEAIALAASFVLPDNAMRNWNAYEKEVQISNQDAFAWVVDPQTNGGLLFTVSEAFVSEVKHLFDSKNLPLYEVGRMVNSGVVVR